MKIIVDAMGGDLAPREIVKGCVEAAVEYRDVELVLVGRRDSIEAELKRLGVPGGRFEIVHSSDVIESGEAPVKAIKKKKDSSMVRGFELLKKDRNAVFISAGNTGALMAGALLKVGRIKGINRPALAPLIPTRKGVSLLIDAGANTDCRVENLVQFGIMGSIYMERVLGKKNPSVGLVNIGKEEMKGNEVVKGAYKRLKELNIINFVGNVEGREIPEGAADVLVCDGFVGNVVLKLTEGLALTLFGLIKERIVKNFLTKLGGLFLKPVFANLKKTMDYTEYGGAPLLGINGGVIKAHGSSNARAIKNAIRQGRLFIQNNVLGVIKDSIATVKEE